MFIQNRLGLIESTETMLSQQNRLTKVTNNLANVDTPGFKKEDVTFWEMLFQANDGRERVGKAIKEVTNFTPGPIQQTGNPLDFAIGGDGFFRVQTPEGVRYTRAGNFTVNNQGQLVTPQGHVVLSDGGALVIDGNQVSVAADGSISVDGQEAGALSVVRFNDPSALQKTGQNLFSAPPEAGEEQALDFSIKQGYLEKSNVNVISAMTALIDLNRAHATQQRLIHTFDAMDERAISRVGKLNS